MKQATKRYLFLFVVAGALIFAGCNTQPEDPLSEPLLLVAEKPLTKGMLYSAIPNNLPEADSINFAQDYINRWIRSELLLRKAELNLTPDEKNVQHLLEEYRRSLLVHQYQQKLLEQKYSPLITGSEIQTYYEKMTDNFKLTSPIIKGVFVIVPKTAPNIDELKELYRSDDSEDMIKLEAYCFTNAKKYEVFFDHWLPLDQINSALPERISKPEQFLKYRKDYKTSDSLYHYFFSIKEYKLIGEVAPRDFVEEKIKAILLNKKRLEFIKQLEADLYEEGLKQKIIKFY